MMMETSEERPTFLEYLARRHEQIVAEKETYIFKQITLINRQRTLIEILLALHAEELPREIVIRVEEIERLSK